MADQWQIARGKSKEGPLSFSELRSLAAKGRLSPTDMVIKDGSQKWTAAGTVAGLFDETPVPTPPPPLPPAAPPDPVPAQVSGFPDIREIAASGSLPPLVIGVGVALAPPLGLYCVWRHPRWSDKEKWIWTGAAALALLVGLAVIPRIALALSVVSGCALWFCLIQTHPGMDAEHKRMPQTLSVFACVIGLTIVLLAGRGFDGGGSGSSGTDTSSDAYKAGYKVGHAHGVEFARDVLSVQFGGPGDGVYGDALIESDVRAYDEPHVKGGPHSLKEPAKAEWIQGCKDGMKAGLGAYYKKSPG